MASQQTLFHVQNMIDNARAAVVHGFECADVERSNNKLLLGDGTGTLYPENLETWKSLYTSAIQLQLTINSLISTLKDECDVGINERTA